jgi:hypothetical protein
LVFGNPSLFLSPTHRHPHRSSKIRNCVLPIVSMLPFGTRGNK